MVNAMYKNTFTEVLYQGTTPTMNFDIPFNQEDIEDITIAFSIKDEVFILKTKEDCHFENGQISILLTQDETLFLEDESLVEIQLKLLLKNNEVVTSDIMKVRVKKAIDKEII